MATALADPVVVGARLTAPDRARLKSFFFPGFGTSITDWVGVTLCTVLIDPISIPTDASSAPTTGAAQLVVQLAAVTMRISGVTRCSLHLMTTFNIPPLSTGALTTTRLTPRFKCPSICSGVKNAPVHSKTSSTLDSFQGIDSGVVCRVYLIFFDPFISR